MGIALAEAGKRRHVDASSSRALSQKMGCQNWELEEDLTLMYVTEMDKDGSLSTIQHAWRPRWTDRLYMFYLIASPLLQPPSETKVTEVRKEHLQIYANNVGLQMPEWNRNFAGATLNTVRVRLRDNKVELVEYAWSPKGEDLSSFRDPSYKCVEEYFLKDGKPDFARFSNVEQGRWPNIEGEFRTHIALPLYFQALAEELPRASKSILWSSELLANPRAGYIN